MKNKMLMHIKMPIILYYQIIESKSALLGNNSLNKERKESSMLIYCHLKKLSVKC